jgi:hypothetical protein
MAAVMSSCFTPTGEGDLVQALVSDAEQIPIAVAGRPVTEQPRWFARATRVGDRYSSIQSFMPGRRDPSGLRVRRLADLGGDFPDPEDRD